jgi:hypothetical protein
MNLLVKKALEPPMRDLDGWMVGVRVRRFPELHLLTSAGANADEPADKRLPMPEQPLLSRLSVPQLAELIEQYVEFVDEQGTAVHLPTRFVEHFIHRSNDDVLPIASAITTLPLVLPDGAIMAGPGLNRDHGIIFRVPPAIVALLPQPEQCTPDLVRRAYRFLTETWLCDVATDEVGKAVIISAALALIERSLLPNRPAYFVTAGRRGGGKTTLLVMLLMAITGLHPAAAAWSSSEDERRKALITYLLEGLAAIIWDNIPRGAQISCPHIERACTAAWYTDRRLGVNEQIATSAATLQLFTGNNIGAKGDLASRKFEIRIDVDRPDPENRAFRHPDPVGWTEANRGKILRALFILLLGNPRLLNGANSDDKTRFKEWWRLCGAAVEHAAALCGATVDFGTLSLHQEADEEESASLADVLDALARKYGDGAEHAFTAVQLARLINGRNAEWTANPEDRDLGGALLQLLYPGVIIAPNTTIDSRAVGPRLRQHLDAPVPWKDDILTLRRRPMAGTGGHATAAYFVQGRPK